MTIPNSEPESDARAPSAPRRPGAGTPARLALHFAVVCLGAGALAALLAGARSGASVALGVTLAALNLLAMQRLTTALVSASGAGAAWAIALPFKLVALVGLAYALVATGVAEPVPLVLGFAVLPLTGVFLPRATSVPAFPTSAPHRTTIPGQAGS